MNKQEMQETIVKLIFSMRCGEHLKTVMRFVTAQSTDKNGKYINKHFKMNDKMFPNMKRATYNENRAELVKQGFIKPIGRAFFSGTELLEYFIESDEFAILSEDFK